MNSTNSTNSLQIIDEHMHSPQILAKFTGILDRSALPYIQSVMIAVESNEGLQKCTPESIAVAALRAASLELSCDPSVRQAHLVPYKRNKKVGNSWTSYYEAQFQPHYMGLFTLAMRTKKYRTIDVLPTPAGYSLVHDLESGMDQLVNEKGQPVAFMPKVKPDEAGGWYGFFSTKDGYVKKVYMTVQEIHAHAEKFSKSYNATNAKGEKTSLWHDKNHKATMEKKTVLLELLRWADLSGISSNALREALSAAEEVVDVEAEEVPATAEEQVDPGIDFSTSNPDPVSPDGWKYWDQAVAEADILGIEHGNPVRENVTAADLKIAYSQLRAKINQAKILANMPKETE